MSEQARESRARQVAQGLLLFSLAVAVRAIPFGQVLEPDMVHFPFGADEFYHLRRIWFGVVNFPSVIDFDPYLNFPDGARAVWPPLFDWVLAGTARLLVGSGDPLAMERLLAWVPPVLGGATVVCIWRIGREFFSPAAGLAAGLLLAVLPAHYANSQLGQLDHHVAVALATCVLLWSGMRLLAERGGILARGTFVGVAFALVVLLWPGALLHVVVVQAASVLWLLSAATQQQAVARARILAFNHAATFALLLPFCLGQRWVEFGDWSPLVLSRFQPLWFGAATCCLAGASVLWARRSVGVSRTRRVVSALVLGGAGVVLAFATVPELFRAIDYASGWFTEDEAFQSLVPELVSLVYQNGEFVAGAANSRFSLLFWVFPFAWLGLSLDSRSRSDAAARGLLLLWALAFFGGTLLQFRFLNSFSVVFALVLGAAGSALVSRARTEHGRTLALVVGFLLVAGSTAAFLPVLGYYSPAFGNSVRVLSGKPLVLQHYERNKRVVERASRWLRENSPTTSGYLSPTEAPEYGVLANWGIGHHVRYRSERPLPQDNFGVYGGRTNYELSEAYFRAPSEEQALAIAARLGLRYVLSDPGGSGQAKGYPGRAMTFRLNTRLGSGGPLGGSMNPGLSRHRLVYVDDDRDMMPTRSPKKPYRVAIFEIVEGALVVGRAGPGSLVNATLDLKTGENETHSYRSWTSAGADGRYELRLPYPTAAGAGSRVSATGAYALESDEQTAKLFLTEEDVRRGSTVAGPDFE